MNICLLSSDYLPNIGGIANHVAELARALKKLGNQVVVVTVKHNNDSTNRIVIEEDKGVKIIRVPFIDVYKIRGLTIRLSYLHQLKKILKEYNIDIVHWHCLGHDSYVTKKIDFDNIVFTNHSSHYLQMMGKGEFEYLRNQVFHAKEIIAPSEELCSETIRLGYDENKVHNISNGVDIERFKPNIDVTKLKEQLGISKKDKVVVCGRRFVKKNGVIYLVKSIPKIINELGVNIKFVFVGDTPDNVAKSEKKEILEFIENNNLAKNVVFTGAIASDNMPRYFSIGDISVLPSLQEATSLSGLESMACEVPVVGTNVGGIPEIIKDGYNGLIVPPMDSNKLGDAIIDLLNDDEKRHDFGIKARKFVVDNFLWIAAAKKTIEVYEKVTQK